MNQLDVIVIGAGAAGLKAAQDLSWSGARFIVLEARDRIGGRILTVRDPRVPAPIELGAEFLHGPTPEIDRILQDAVARSYEVVGCRWHASNGKLVEINDYFERLNRVMRGLDANRTPDQSFADYLETHLQRPEYAKDKRLARQFVEGFHAASVTRVSERWLANGGNPGEEEDSRQMRRVVEGYDRVTEWLGADVADRIVRCAPVHRIEWSRDHVRVHVLHGREEQRFTARKAIITIPLGVLQARVGEIGAVEFSPDIPAIRRATTSLAMGRVTRLTLLFSERFWEHRRNAPNGRRIAQTTFIQGLEGDVPVWWTLFPMQMPVLTGWAGGPASERLAAYDLGEITERALSSLAAILGAKRARVESFLLDVFMHDWTRDPYSRGAYSYALVGGSGANSKLARPIEDTLFFAGEAADVEGRTGTVEGALESGKRAAREVLRRLRE